MIITLEVPPDMEKQLQRAARTQGKDIAAFLLANVQRHLRQDVLPETEANLLQAINTPLAPEVRQQRDALLALQQQRELTDTERETLTHLIDAVELANAKRWQSLAELAERRGLSLAEIAQELEIPLA
jgi:hypothetical protein